MLIALVALLFPQLPFAGASGFVLLSLHFYGAMLATVTVDLVSAKILERPFDKVLHKQ